MRLVKLIVLQAAFTVVIMALCAFAILVAVSHIYYNERQTAGIEYLATPLSKQTIQEFCENGLIEVTSATCIFSTTNLMYRDIPLILGSRINDTLSHEQVDEFIGMYLFSCTTPQEREVVYRCRYKVENFHFFIEYDRYSDRVVNAPFKEQIGLGS